MNKFNLPELACTPLNYFRRVLSLMKYSFYTVFGFYLPELKTGAQIPYRNSPGIAFMRSSGEACICWVLTRLPACSSRDQASTFIGENK